jgi:hypothetical protein
MTSQTPEELDEALEEAVSTTLEDITVHWRDGDNATMMQAIAPALAAIRRHAAAQALRQQADRHNSIGRGFMAQAATVEPGSVTHASLILNAQNAHTCAGRLRRAADEIIAEGWEHTCAASTPATREDPAEGCETPVEHEGDYCPRHEPADDHDPRDDR